MSDVREENCSAAVESSLRRAVRALEGPHVALGDLLQGHLAQDVPAGQQHWRIVGRALLPGHRAGKY